MGIDVSIATHAVVEAQLAPYVRLGSEPTEFHVEPFHSSGLDPMAMQKAVPTQSIDVVAMFEVDVEFQLVPFQLSSVLLATMQKVADTQEIGPCPPGGNPML